MADYCGIKWRATRVNLEISTHDLPFLRYVVNNNTCINYNVDRFNVSYVDFHC
jgi:hypothetical protein